MTLRRMLPAVAGLLLLAACGENTTQSREAEVEEYARSQGVDAEVEMGDDGAVRSVVIHHGDGQVGAHLALPDDFPDDVALYPESNVVSVIPTPAGLSVIAHTQDDMETVMRFLAAEMARQGWVEDSPAQAVPAMRMLRFSKGARSAMFNFVAADSGTSVTLVLMGTS